MTLPTQTIRDALLVATISCSVLAFWQTAFGYLSVLKNPLPMMAALVLSLLLSFIYDLKHGVSRVAFVSLATSCLFFAAAPSVASLFRDYYLFVLRDLQDVQKIDPHFMESTTEYVSALHNPAVGIGSCFALALATLRLPLQKITNKVLGILFIEPKQNECCSLCGQIITQPTKATLTNNLDKN